jgi:endonuclease III related protein
MPTLHDWLPDVAASLAVQFARSGPDFAELTSSFEAIIAVMLARNIGRVNWKSLLDALGESGLLDPHRLANVESLEIADAVRGKKRTPSIKTLAPLKQLARWFDKRGDVSDIPTGQLRDELAALKGIGAAGADAILLFALGRPSYPVDRATFRILVRHGWLDISASYEEARDTLTSAAATTTGGGERDDTNLLQDLSRGFEDVGRVFCRAAAPHCDRCPLKNALPEGGPLDVNE